MERLNSIAFGYLILFRESQSNVAAAHNNSQSMVSEKNGTAQRGTVLPS